MDFGIASVATVTVICYLLGRTAKTAGLAGKWIPTLVGVAGGLLGLAGLYLMQDFPADEPLTALAVGIVSGLASTGIHQAVKQRKGA